MKWLDKIKDLITKTEKPYAGLDDERLLEWLGIKGTPQKMLSEVTYFTCLKILPADRKRNRRGSSKRGLPSA